MIPTEGSIPTVGMGLGSIRYVWNPEEYEFGDLTVKTSALSVFAQRGVCA